METFRDFAAGIACGLLLLGVMFALLSMLALVWGGAREWLWMWEETRDLWKLFFSVVVLVSALFAGTAPTAEREAARVKATLGEKVGEHPDGDKGSIYLKPKVSK